MKINHNTHQCVLSSRSILHRIDSSLPCQSVLHLVVGCPALLGCCHVTGPSASSLDGPMGLCVVVGCSVCPWPYASCRGSVVSMALRASLCCQWVLCIVDGPSELSWASILSIGLLLRDSPAVLSIHPLGANGLLSRRWPPSCYSLAALSSPAHVCRWAMRLVALISCWVPVPSCRVKRCRSAHLRRHWHVPSSSGRCVVVEPVSLSFGPLCCRWVYLWEVA